ncbi:MAG: endonuclease MutS2 [Bacteriovoracaceae bacterium]
MQLNLLDNNEFYGLRSLEWESIIHELSKNCHFEVSIENFHEPVLSLPQEEIQLDYQSLNFFVQLSYGEDYHELRSYLTRVLSKKTLRENLERLKKSAVLELLDLHQVVKIYESFDQMLSILKDWPQLTTYYKDREDHKTTQRLVVKTIRSLISPDGEINYKNHPELSKLHEKQIELEGKIRLILSNLSQDPLFSERLQFTGHDVIHDRYVVAVRTDSYQANMGPIISRSETGLTLYVEPYLVKDLDSARLQVMSKMAEIINQLCLQYSSLIHGQLNLFLSYYGALLEIDHIIAKTEFTLKHHLVEPTFSLNGSIHLHGLFHPLIKNAVKNDVLIDSGYSGLVISGPNTGGKTATLKAITLCHLFMHMGLFVPAREATIPVMDGIFYLGNDGQDLSQGLSSFSSEVKSYLQLFTEFKGNNLIVIDEIFNSTSSEEASALAISLFEEIEKRTKAKIIISTHHQMLKTFMHSDKTFLSAHVGFDVINHRPNYKLIMGIPGSSMALSIFKNLSHKSALELSIVERATGILENKLVMYESLLQEVSKKKNEFDLLIHETNEMKHQLKNQVKSQEGVLRLKMQDTLSEFQQKLEFTLREGERLVQKVQEGEVTKRKQFDNKAFELTSTLRQLEVAPAPVAQEQKNIKPREFKVGNRYYFPMLDRNVELKSMNEKRNEAQVMNGNITVRCKLDDLYLPKGNKGSLGNNNTVSIHFETRADLSHNYDCRGMRLDEFENLIDKAVSSLILGEVPFLHIVHGHGDGILKSWLRKYLKGFPNLSFEIPEHAHDGATRINLKS